MIVPYDQDWLTARDVAACLGVNRTTLLRMIREKRFPQPCRHERLRALWRHGIVSDKLRIQLELWLGKKLLAESHYKPLVLKRTVGLTRRGAEKLLGKIEAQERKRSTRIFAAAASGKDQLEKATNINRVRETFAHASTIARAYSEGCAEARKAGTPLSTDEKVGLYKRLARPDDDELRRFRKAAELAEASMRKPLKVEVVCYSEPEATLSTSVKTT